MTILRSGDILPHVGGPRAGRLDFAEYVDHTTAIQQATPITGCFPLFDIGIAKLEICWTIPIAFTSVSLSLKFNGTVLWQYTLSASNVDTKLHLGFPPGWEVVKVDLDFSVDFDTGEVHFKGAACVWQLTDWSCAQFDQLLVAWNPTRGSVGGRTLAHAPVLEKGQQFGPSLSVVPTINRIMVDNTSRVGTPVGAIVKSTFFADHPDFMFNVCFAVGDFFLTLPGPYVDPRSRWFNVFTGYYELVVEKKTWGRPFAYEALEQGKAPVVRFDDMIRIGLADWNYFSNWMYGVPLEAIAPYDKVSPSVKTAQNGRKQIGKRYWDHIGLDNVTVVSAYYNGRILLPNCVLTPIWQLTFGAPSPVDSFPRSFISTNMQGGMYLSYYEDGDCFRTVIFGGTANNAFSDATEFIDAQLHACEAIIETHYPDIGFPSP